MAGKSTGVRGGAKDKDKQPLYPWPADILLSHLREAHPEFDVDFFEEERCVITRTRSLTSYARRSH